MLWKFHVEIKYQFVDILKYNFMLISSFVNPSAKCVNCYYWHNQNFLLTKAARNSAHKPVLKMVKNNFTELSSTYIIRY